MDREFCKHKHPWVAANIGINHKGFEFCKICHTIQQSKSRKDKWSRDNFGLADGEAYDALYMELVEKQQGLCACCGEPGRARVNPKEMKRVRDSLFQTYWLVMDHCHDTGEIRGLLCTRCNLGIGVLGDTVEALEQALVYLRGKVLVDI